MSIEVAGVKLERDTIALGKVYRAHKYPFTFHLCIEHGFAHIKVYEGADPWATPKVLRHDPAFSHAVYYDDAVVGNVLARADIADTEEEAIALAVEKAEEYIDSAL